MKTKLKLLMLSHPKILANRLNAQLSTGPKTCRGKRVSSKNSTKHGLNVEIDFESSDAYASLKSLLVEEGYLPFVAADIAANLLNYRRVMDVYYDIYTKTKEVDESTWDMNLEGIYTGLRSMAKGSEVTASETLSVLRVFARSQRDERRLGGPVFRRTADCHKLIRYQRNSISRLSKAIRPE
ncbi:hypothetical protein OAQ81_01735 [Candidatus Thioglobus sp.]|nr:hypothetical protein [Candidatus Thioglobus sp.]